jgi:hypothetical protein
MTVLVARPTTCEPVVANDSLTELAGVVGPAIVSHAETPEDRKALQDMARRIEASDCYSQRVGVAVARTIVEAITNPHAHAHRRLRPHARCSGDGAWRHSVFGLTGPRLRALFLYAPPRMKTEFCHVCT